MIHASSSIELDEFELVEAAPGTALLRVAARTASPEAQRPIHLLVQSGPDRHRLTPLPAPPDAPGLLRVAFSAPSASVAGATFSLELPNGSVVALPTPRTARRIVQPGAPSQAQQDEAQAQGDELQALRNSAAEMAGQLDEAQARVEALAEVVRRQTAAREAVIEQLERAEQARVEAEGTANELRTQVEQLSARMPSDDPGLARLEARLADADAAAPALLMRAQSAEAAQAQAVGRIQELETQLADQRLAEADRAQADDTVAALRREIQATRLDTDSQIERARLPALVELVERQALAEAARALAERTAERLTAELQTANDELRHSNGEVRRPREGQHSHPEAIQLRALELLAQERARVRALADVAAAGAAVAAGSSQLGN